MDYPKYVRDTFEQEVRTIFAKKPSIIPFFLNHERRKRAEENLIKEIKHTEWKKGVWLNQHRIERIAKAAVRRFCDLALMKKEHELRSEAENARLDKYANREKDAAQAFNDMMKDGAVSPLKHSEKTIGGDEPTKI